MAEAVKPRFSIVRSVDSANSATLSDGTKVHRVDKIFIREWSRFVTCSPDDVHFIYEVPPKKKGYWFAGCSCGSPAVIVGSNAYAQYGSSTDTGEMVICYHFVMYGKHSDGTGVH